MDGPGDITNHLSDLLKGDPQAVQPLWDEYFTRLVSLARTRLRNGRGGIRGPEDVALDAFDSFCRRAAAGRFRKLHNRTDLWGRLMKLTVNKAIDAVRRQEAEKRGGGWTRSAADLEEFLARGPSLSAAAEVADRFRHLMDLLPDDTFRRIVQLKLEGHTHPEIGMEVGVALATVDRKLALVRRLWAEADGDE